MKHTTRTTWRATAAALVAAMALAACGGGDGTAEEAAATGNDQTTAPTGGESSPPDDASTGASGGDGIAEAEALVAEWTQYPTDIGVETPIDGDIPSDRRVVFVSCGVPICEANGDAFTEAAHVFGWTVDRVNAGLTPESIKSAWDQIVRDMPDAVVASGYPRVLFEDALAQMEEANVPLVECCVADEPGDGILAVLGKTTTALWAQQMAAWVVAERGADANVLWVTTSDYPILEELTDEFLAEYERLCPDCPSDTLNTPSTEIGAGLPTDIVGYLRSHPDVNYVGLAIDAMSTGLPAALETADLQGVGVIGQGGDPLNQQHILDGTQDASVPYPVHEAFWLAADTLARFFAGAPQIDASSIELPAMILTQETVSDASDYSPLIADYQEQFKSVWGMD